MVTGDASVGVEGVLGGTEATTSAGQIAWNFFNGFSLLMILGFPMVGTQEAEVELRLYSEEGGFLGAFRGTGEAYWQARYMFYKTVPDGKEKARVLARRAAVWDAVRKMTRDLQTH